MEEEVEMKWRLHEPAYYISSVPVMGYMDFANWKEVEDYLETESDTTGFWLEDLDP